MLRAALGGRADGEVKRAQLESWREVTRGAFRLHLIPGDHFYLFTREMLFIALIADRLPEP